MKWAHGEKFHPYEYRFFEGGTFPVALRYEEFSATLNTSFRVWLKFDQLMQTRLVTDKERILLAIKLCVEKIDDNFPIDKLREGLLWFHSADGLDRSHLFDSPKRKNHKDLYLKLKEKWAKNKPGVSLFWDSQLIWSAFMSTFNMDLFAVELHWWSFLSLLEELPSDCALYRASTQRTKDIKEVKDVREREEFLIKQHLTSIPNGGLLEGERD